MALPLSAQETSTEEKEEGIVFIKTITDEDGSEITIKKCLKDEEAWVSLLQSFQSADEAESGTQSMQEVEGETLFLFRRAGETNEQEELREVRILSTIDKCYSVKVERDPCRVFIGVRLSGKSELQVSGIIDDTPAAISKLQEGDIITAINGVSVNTAGELIAERNKHEPGEAFTLTVQRDGKQKRINARFKDCEQADDTEEKIDLPPVQQDELGGLSLQQFRAFPNPSFGRVQVQFEAEAVPTTVQLTDATGKVVYTEQLNSFNGTYNREIDLKDAAPGTIVLSIKQGQQVTAKKLVLLNRA
jgi:hypothetical protein